MTNARVFHNNEIHNNEIHNNERTPFNFLCITNSSVYSLVYYLILI